MTRTLLILTVIIFTTTVPPGVVIIHPENAGKILRPALIKQHCINMGFGADNCDAKDFEGVAADLNGNAKAEFLLRNAKLEKNNKTCALYMDEKRAYMFVQAEMPCKIELMKTKTNGWYDIKGVIYPTDCEPLVCEYKWGGSSYLRGGCVPFDDEGCKLE